MNKRYQILRVKSLICLNCIIGSMESIHFAPKRRKVQNITLNFAKIGRKKMLLTHQWDLSLLLNGAIYDMMEMSSFRKSKP